jgi:hypothetical protein
MKTAAKASQDRGIPMSAAYHAIHRGFPAAAKRAAGADGVLSAEEASTMKSPYREYAKSCMEVASSKSMSMAKWMAAINPRDLPALQEVPGAAGGAPEKVWDAQVYFAHWLGIPKDGKLRLYHCTKKPWAEDPKGHVKATGTPVVNGRACGDGFYMSTIAMPSYGPQCLEVEIPMSALRGLLVCEGHAPAHGSVVFRVARAHDNPTAKNLEVVLLPQGESWFNEAMTKARFRPTPGHGAP